MNQKSFTILPAFIWLMIWFFSCRSTQESSDDQLSASDVIGTWSNLSLNITFPALDSVYDVPRGEWETKLGIKPIITTFEPGGKYYSRYYNLNDSLIHSSNGEWQLKKDTLYLTENEQITAYHMIINGVEASFEGTLDWDQDGMVEEIYFGIQQKIK